MTKNTLNSGSVTLQLTDPNGKDVEHKLLPTLGAALKINDEFGGLVAADGACVKMDVRAIGAVLCHALNGEAETADYKRDEVIEMVVRTGTQPCCEAARAYLDLVYRGGKAKSVEGGKTTADPSKQKAATTAT